jgi:ABC-2 type transport system permease protein
LKSSFNSPIAYIVTVAFLVFTAVWLFYLNQFFSRNEASLRIYFQIVPTVFVFLIPALTMRSWAEERRTGTLEILLTLPFREWEVVLAKFLGAFCLLALVIALTIPLPLSLSSLGRFDGGQIAGEYLGVLFTGAAGIAVGLFFSSLSTNQITSFIMSVLALLAFTLLNQVNFLVALPRWLAAVFNYVSFGQHFESFRRGVIDTRDMLYFLLVTAAFLALNVQVLVRRKRA